MMAARFNLLTFLVKYDRVGSEGVDCKWQPPRDTSMGQNRDDGDGGLVIFAATGREEALAIRLRRGKRYECYEYYSIQIRSFHLVYFMRTLCW